MKRVLGILAVGFAIALGGAAAAQETQGPGLGLETSNAAPLTLAPGTGFRHAIAMHGEPHYAEGFAHFDYADPLATHGGELVIPEVDTFDSLNPFIVTGAPAWPVYYYVFDRLMAR